MTKPAVQSNAVVLLIVAPIVCGASVFGLVLVLFFITLDPSSFKITLMGKRELVAIL